MATVALPLLTWIEYQDILITCKILTYFNYLGGIFLGGSVARLTAPVA